MTRPSNKLVRSALALLLALGLLAATAVESSAAPHKLTCTNLGWDNLGWDCTATK